MRRLPTPTPMASSSRRSRWRNDLAGRRWAGGAFRPTRRRLRCFERPRLALGLGAIAECQTAPHNIDYCVQLDAPAFFFGATAFEGVVRGDVAEEETRERPVGCQLHLHHCNHHHQPPSPLFGLAALVSDFLTGEARGPKQQHQTIRFGHQYTHPHSLPFDWQPSQACRGFESMDCTRTSHRRSPTLQQ